MHASTVSHIRLVGAPVAHSKLTAAVQDRFPGVGWESAPDASQFAGHVRRLWLAKFALWNRCFGTSPSGHYDSDGLPSNLATCGAGRHISDAGKSSQLATMLRQAIMKPRGRRQSWSFVSLMGLTGEPWSLGKPLIGKVSPAPNALHMSWDVHRHDTIFDHSARRRSCVSQVQGWEFLELVEIGIGGLHHILDNRFLRRYVDWHLDRIRDRQAEETLRRFEWRSQAVLAWRSQCAKSSPTDAMQFSPRQCKVHRSDVVARGCAASGYRGVRHT